MPNITLAMARRRARREFWLYRSEVILSNQRWWVYSPSQGPIGPFLWSRARKVLREARAHLVVTLMEEEGNKHA